MSRTFNGFLSGASKLGRWVPEAELKARAIAGGSTVDFSQALFIHPVITVRTTAFWGGVTLIVPPNVAVEQNGQAILGGFGSGGGAFQSSTGPLPATASDVGITIRVLGRAVMGAVNVVVNQRAKAAELLSWEEAQLLLQETPAEASTTRQDVQQQLLEEALARRSEALAQKMASLSAPAAAVMSHVFAQTGCAQQALGLLAGSPQDTVPMGVPVLSSGGKCL